ncbi:hypothetical protein MVEN_01141200 [Mycena venus]|uniref:F-box domain-containing protein n=1 Tax=Mycena venus TaxID=2733690 RepID=A0A8H6Y785_9AGAR|nr:hypothetical protein MVEN_01141200 [Mycena venus]
MLTLEDLGEDITVLLLSLCDIDTVLLMSRVNQFFRQLTMRKQHCILYVKVSSELIALVKRTVLGPATWSPDTSPTLAEEVSLPDALLAAEDLQLLLGSRYVLLVRENDIELWNICSKTPL